MSAPGDLWPDSQCPEFVSQKPAMFSADFGSDGCTLNFQTADSAAASWGRWKVAVTAGMIQGADGLCRLCLEKGAGGYSADIQWEAAFALHGWHEWRY